MLCSEQDQEHSTLEHNNQLYRNLKTGETLLATTFGILSATIFGVPKCLVFESVCRSTNVFKSVLKHRVLQIVRRFETPGF